MTIKQALADATQKLQKANIPSPHLDGEILLSDALGKPKEFLYAHPEYKMSKSARIRHALFLQRRLNREPIAYIINKKEFYGREFYVDKRVLIPRPKTETIIDQVINLLQKTQNLKFKTPCHADMAWQNHNLKLKSFTFVDIGTGSGCIIISIIKEILDRDLVKDINRLTFIAADISAKALQVAKINAKKHGVEKHIKFLQGNLLEPFIKSFPKFFPPEADPPLAETFIIANLPYITAKQYLTLEPEIKKYEPKLALLTPKEDPDYYYKKLDQQISQLQRLTQSKIYRFYERTN